MLASPPVMALESAPPAPGQAEPAVNVNAPRPALSTEQLLAMRNALATQVAVYDAVDQSWRKPTPSEQEQLSQGPSASGAPRVVTLPNGATAISGAAGELSFLTVELQRDGTLTTSHLSGAEVTSIARVPMPRLKPAAAKKGGRNAE
jgi:hypothetical protein